MRVAPPSPDAQADDQGQNQGQDQPQGDGPAVQSVKMIQQGFKQLGDIIQKSAGSLPPEDMKLFQSAVQATDALIQSLSGPAGQQGQNPPAKAPGGPPQSNSPMPMNANAGAKPAPQY